MLIMDPQTWGKIIAKRQGYIYNDFGTQFPGKTQSWNTVGNNKLHTANCPCIKRMTYKSDEKENKYYFASKEEALRWLNKNRKGIGYSDCSICKP